MSLSLSKYNLHKYLTNSNITHTLYHQKYRGKLHIKTTEELIKNVFETYCKTQFVPAISEQKTPIFKFFIDLDFVKTGKIIKYNKNDIIRIIQLYRSIISQISDNSTASRIRRKSKTSCGIKVKALKNNKGNFHCIFNLSVTQQQSNNIIKIAKKYSTKYLPKFEQDEIEQLFDLCYGGLRVPFTEYKNVNDVYKPFNLKKYRYYSIREFSQLCLIDFTIRLNNVTGALHTELNIDFSKFNKYLIKSNKVTNSINVNQFFQGKRKNHKLEKINFSIEEISKIVDCLSPKRANDYFTWKYIGWCLFNLHYFNGYDEKSMFELWDRFSKQSPKYKPQVLFKEWRKSIKDGYNIGTLCMWAKEDSLHKYLNIIKHNKYKYPIKINDIYTDLLLKNTLDSASPKYLTNGIFTVTEDTKFVSNSEYFADIPKLLDKYNTIIIKAPTGSGKTTLSKSIFGDAPVLSVVSRRSMAGQHKKVFDFELYLNTMNINRFREEKLVCSLEQLSCISDISKFEFLYLDEMASLLYHFSSTTMKYFRRKSWQVLYYLIKNTPKVVITDATLNDACIYLTTSLRDKTKTLFYNNICKNKTNVNVEIFINDICGFIPLSLQVSDHIILKKMYEDISNKKTFTVASDSARLLKKIFQNCVIWGGKYGFTSDDFVLFTAEEGGGTVNTIININDECKNKFIFYSPKIVYGIDITIPYENSYAFFQGKSINSLGLIQQLGRPRNTKNIYISVHNACNYESTYEPGKYTFDEIKQEIKKQVQYHTKYCKDIRKQFNVDNTIDTLMDCCSIVCSKNNSMEISDDALYSNIHYYNEYFNNYINVYKLEALTKFLDCQGYNYKITKVIDDEFNENMQLNQLELDLNVNITHNIRDEYMDQFDSVIFNEKRKLNNDIYVDINDQQENITERVMNISKVLKINDLNVLKKANIPNYFKKILKHPKCIEKLQGSFLLLYKPEYIAQNILNTDELELKSIKKETYRQILFVYKIEKILGIKRFDIDNIKVNSNINKFFKENERNIVTIFSWRDRRERVNELINEKNYRGLMCSIYKAVCKDIFVSNNTTRIWDSDKQKQIKLLQLNTKTLLCLLELKLRFNYNDKHNILDYIYNEYSTEKCLLNKLYNTNYCVISNIS